MKDPEPEPDPHLVLMDPDADPVGPKTYRSCGSRSESATLAERIQKLAAPKNTSCSGGYDVTMENYL
jgi:hypothetical protein